MRMPWAGECCRLTEGEIVIRNFRIIPLLFLMAAVAYLGARLFESRVNQTGF